MGRAGFLFLEQQNILEKETGDGFPTPLTTQWEGERDGSRPKTREKEGCPEQLETGVKQGVGGRCSAAGDAFLPPSEKWGEQAASSLSSKTDWRRRPEMGFRRRRRRNGRERETVLDRKRERRKVVPSSSRL
ncbi:hypothetical protein U1Q18_027483, partial [Sarracenia purpurea var. burkii]